MMIDVSATERDEEDARMTIRINYVTSTDGWGENPTDEDFASFCAYVEHRLEETYPGAIVSAEVDTGVLRSLVTSNSDEIDCEGLCQIIGNDIWNDWCSGERAPKSEAAS